MSSFPATNRPFVDNRDRDTTQHVLVWRQLGLRHIKHDKLPCTLPYDLNRAAWSRILAEKSHWYVTLKADGLRAWFVRVGSCSFFYSRALVRTDLPAGTCPPNIHTDAVTVLDGEQLPCGTFAAFDVLVVNGTPYYDKPFRIRYAALEALRWVPLEMTSEDPAGLTLVSGPNRAVPLWRMKPALPASQLARCFGFSCSSSSSSSLPASLVVPVGSVPSSPSAAMPRDALLRIKVVEGETDRPIVHSCDGLVLMDGEAAYFTRGRDALHATMLKWKTTPTVDLALFPDKYGLKRLFCTGFTQPWLDCGTRDDNGVAVTHEDARDGADGSSCSSRTICIVECVWLAERRWRAVRCRPDKRLPNHEKVVHDTIAVMKEGLTAAALLSAFPVVSPYMKQSTS